jgi:hypothetical protein
MHCIQCGTQNNETTRYCNRCGANLEALRQAIASPIAPEPPAAIGPRHTSLILILSAIVAIAGFGMVFGMLATMATAPTRVPEGDIIGLMIFMTLAGIAGTCFVVWLLMRLLTRPTAGPAAAEPAKPAALRGAQSPALPPARVEPITPSVVEHTTARLAEYAPPPRKDTAPQEK